MNQIETMCTIAEAATIAARFPGCRVVAWETDSSTGEAFYAIITPVADHDRYSIDLEHLVTETKATVEELQSAYGEHAERLALDIAITA